MTRILVQRGSAGSSSSSNQNRSSQGPSSSTTSSVPPSSQVIATNSTSAPKVEESEEIQDQSSVENSLDVDAINEKKEVKSDTDCSVGDSNESRVFDDEKIVAGNDTVLSSADLMNRLGASSGNESEMLAGNSLQVVTGRSSPPPPPVPPPKPSSGNSNLRRVALGGSNSMRVGSPRRAWGMISTRSSPTGSHPSSPRSHCESEGYNSADEQNACYGRSLDDAERERQFEIDLRRIRGLEVRRMVEDGNCLFRAVADQVYGDSDLYDLVRQMCIDYMEQERDHFSQFITEGFTSYCKRKRRDKVYGNNVEIQAFAEMYNRPIHIYAYGTEPINTFHGNYSTDTPPIRLSYHQCNHYNSLVDPRRLTIGAGLGFSSLQGSNVDKDQVKAAIKAQQEQQIDNALLAEGRYYSDLELTEKEIERMVIETSRAEYLASDKFKQQHGVVESSTSSAETSSSGARSSGNETKLESGRRDSGLSDTVLNSCMQMVLSMGFSYLQVLEAYSIFGDDVDSMVCYLVETSNSTRRKGKATE